jgi:PAS domain S-box-containing protein
VAVWLGLFILVVLGGLLITTTYRDADQQHRVALLNQATLITESLNPALITQLTGTDADLSSPAYQTLKHQLMLMRQAHHQCRFVYLMSRRPNGEVYFLVDSEPPESEDYSPPGQVYHEADEVEAALFDNGSSLVVGPTVDRWGSWVTALVGMTDQKTGRVMALFGMDVAADEWSRGLRRATLPAALLTAALLALLAGASLLFIRRRRHAGAEPSWMTLLEPICVLSFGLLLAIFSAYTAYRHKHDEQITAFKTLAASETDLIASRIRSLQDKDLSVITRFVENSEEITREEFVYFSANLLNDPAIYAWTWIPEVQAKDRTTFIAHAQANGIPIDNLWEKSPDGIPVAAGERSVYYPVLFVNPIEQNEGLYGFDSGSETHRQQAITRAIKTKMAVSTPPIPLAHLGHDVTSMIVYQPTQLQHPGCIGLALNLRGILPAAHENASMHYALEILNLNQTPTLLDTTCTNIHAAYNTVLSRPLAAFNELFWITAHPNKNIFTSQAIRYAAWTFGSISMISAAMALLIGMPIRRRTELQRLVAMRTEELRQKEENFRVLTESMRDVVWTMDGESMRYTYISPSVFKLRGYTAEDVMARPATDIMAENQREDAARVIRQRVEALRSGAITTDTFFVDEIEQGCRDGTTVWTEVVTSVRTHPDTGRIELYGVTRDITERHRAEADYRKSQLFLSDLFEHSGALIYIKNRRGVYHMINRKWEEVTGLSRQQVIGNTDQALFPEAVARHFIANDNEVMEKQCAIEREEVLENPDGDRHFVSVKFPWRDARGEIIGVCGISTEITALKQSQIELARLASAIEQAAETVVITDLNGIVQYVNPAFCKVTGYTREEMLGQHTRMLKSGKQDDVFYQHLWSTLMRGQVWTGRLVNRKKNGELYTEDATISPVYDHNGKLINFVAVKRDISREIEIEQQLAQSQKMEIVGQLAGGVAHDFNNILQSMLGFTELAMMEDNIATLQREFLPEIRRAGESAASLTRQLLAFSRRQVLEKKIIVVNELIDRMGKMIRRVIGEDMLLEFMLTPHANLVCVDPGQMEQVILNLVVNARDAMPQGGRLIISTNVVSFSTDDLLLHPDALAGSFVCVTVSDTGSGMTPEVRRHIFEPFFTTKGIGKGTGLGLATVFGIVKQHDGWISVYSEPDKGTEFHIYLPRQTTGETGEQAAASVPAPQGAGQRILLCEDEDMVRTLIARLLTRHGYQVQLAASAEEALEVFFSAPEPFDLVFSDVVLPGKSGFDLVSELKTRAPTLKVLMASGYTDDRTRWAQIKEQGWRYLQKPVSAHLLLQTLSDMLNKPST